MSLSRRGFLKLSMAMAGVGAVTGLAGCQSKGSVTGAKRVVVIGGGFGGATAAKYVKLFDPTVDVTMIDGQSSHTTCPFSNLVIGGLKEIDEITHNFTALEKRGVNVVKGWVTGIDADNRVVTLEDGRTYEYDRLVVSPGIDFNYDAIEAIPRKSPTPRCRMPGRRVSRPCCCASSSRKWTTAARSSWPRRPTRSVARRGRMNASP